jgi:hypothetical protein
MFSEQDLTHLRQVVIMISRGQLENLTAIKIQTSKLKALYNFTPACADIRQWQRCQKSIQGCC